MSRGLMDIVVKDGSVRIRSSRRPYRGHAELEDALHPLNTEAVVARAAQRETREAPSGWRNNVTSSPSRGALEARIAALGSTDSSLVAINRRCDVR